MNKRFSNQVSIITGGATGIGYSVAKRLGEEGSKLVIVDQDADLGKQTVAEFNASDMNAVLVIGDVSDEKVAENAVAQAKKNWDRLDVLINNATTNPRKHPKYTANFESYPLELWQKYIDVNLTGLFLCSQEIGKVMAKQRNGVIVNISSIYGNVGADQRIYGKKDMSTPVAYAATKGAFLNFTRYVAANWHKKNVRVNTLSLGGVFKNHDKEFVKKYSEKTILGRMAKKDEYEGAILFLMSDASSYMTGSNLVIDGGWTTW